MNNTDLITMMPLGFSSDELERFESNKVDIKKHISRIMRKARNNAKRDTCFVCGKTCSSFCNSHSVPQFCLRNIAIDGKVFHSGIQKVMPLLGDDTGVKSAGTFHLICENCDNTLFQDYETPEAYDREVSSKTLAEIALKNYLQQISKRYEENEIYSILKENSENAHKISQQQLDVNNLDLMEYTTHYNRARLAVMKNHDDWYYLCYYKKLNYVVPIAFQGAVTMISDFNDNIINDIYNMSSNYHPQDIHIAVFPLESSSVVMMFIDSKAKRYRSFYRQLNKLSEIEQLAAINYIIHSYSENVFLSKSLEYSALNDPVFLEECQKTGIALSFIPSTNTIQKAVEAFSLSKRNIIPNLLSRDYALKT